MGSRGGGDIAIRHSVAPRVLDGSLVQNSLASTAHFSVRAVPPETPNSPILTTFVWKDAGARVQLAGSFDDWRKHDMTYVSDVGTFVLVTEVPPGCYFYRFVVDGRWKVAEDDPNLREDMFGEMSHYLDISAEAVANAKPRRFSTATVTRSDIAGTVVLDEGASDTEGDDDNDDDTDEMDDGDGDDGDDEVDPRKSVPLPPRQRGSGFVEDYDDDMCGELDLQADVFEAMKDVKEKTTDSAPTSPTAHSANSHPRRAARKRRKPGRRMIARVWAMLFGEAEEEEPPPAPPTRNQNLHAMAGRRKSGKRGLRVWFPNEQNYPETKGGRKIAPSETKDVIDVGEKAMKLHQVEDNANNRQMLGKTLFAQGKYDAALALFSLSVKLRVDNGLKNAKTTAIAHTDVASAFIHLEDYKNAEKHLRIALAIFEKGTFSGGRVQLGDVHCFLGVVADMRNDLRAAELGYRNAIDLYEKSKSTDHNPNYGTAVDNLNQNLKRQKQAEMAGATAPVKLEPGVAPQQSAPPQQQHPREPSTQSRGGSAARAPRSPRAPSQTRVKRRAAEGPQGVRAAPAPASSAGRTPPPGGRAPAAGGRAPSAGGRAPSRRAPVKRAAVPGYEDDEALPVASTSDGRRGSARPKTWKELAEHARASMPRAPPVETPSTVSVDEDAPTQAGSYEEMSRGWHKDGRRLLVKGEFKEAIDMYTLAIYTRKRHGPWHTKDNAQTHVEYARALFATRDLRTASETLRDAILILETVGGEDNALLLGETWGSLGAVLDRLGGHMKEAETAHCTGMVVYGRAGMSTEDKRWMKAWRNLCASLSAQGAGARTTDEVWEAIDLQIRGVAPMTKAANVVLRG